MSTSISEGFGSLDFIYDIWFNIFILDETEPCRSLKLHCCLHFLIELLTARNDNLPLHASPTSKSNEIVLLEISLQSIRLALGSDCTFKRHCLPARPLRLPAVKETNKNRQNQRQRNGKGSSPPWHKRTRQGLSSWEWLAIRNILKPLFECVRQTKAFHWGVLVRCFLLGRASDLVSNCVARLTRMVCLGAFQAGFLLHSCSLPVRSTTKDTRKQKDPSDSVLTSICLVRCAKKQA